MKPKSLFCLRFTFALVLALVFSSAVVGLNNGATNKIKMLVLYESLCPDSVGFMQRQLAPNYDDFKDVIDITLVPFGKSHSTEGGAHFFCQHGPKECLGNRQQSCVLHQTEDQSAQVKYAVCQMSPSPSPSRALEECALQAGLSPDIGSCLNSQLGTSFQLNAERITNLYNPSFIPTIIFNEVFDQELQNNSLHDLRGTLCYLLRQRGTGHSACN